MAETELKYRKELSQKISKTNQAFVKLFERMMREILRLARSRKQGSETLIHRVVNEVKETNRRNDALTTQVLNGFETQRIPIART